MYTKEMLGTTVICREISMPLSRVRTILMREGVTLRTLSQSMLDSKPHQKYIARRTGVKTGPLSQSQRDAMRLAALARADLGAAGVSFKSKRYAEYTRGPNKGRSVHVVTMEQHMGRKLSPNEVVHHKDENKINNDISNLQLMTGAEHARLHRLMDIEKGIKLEKRFNTKGKSQMAQRSVNRVTLLGTLGRDAETKFTPSGVSVTKFSIATNKRWKDQKSGEWKEETNWTNVTLWRQENIGQFLLKGKQVYVEGSLKTSSYDGKDGKKVYTAEVVADEVILLGGKSEGGERPVPATGGGARNSDREPAGHDPFDGQGIDDTDVPF